MADTPRTFRVSVDRELCAAHGRCYELAPDVFEADADGYSTVKQDTLGPDARPLLDRVAQLCPELAIRIEDDSV
jgi:ferredoxin